MFYSIFRIFASLNITVERLLIFSTALVAAFIMHNFNFTSRTVAYGLGEYVALLMTIAMGLRLYDAGKTGTANNVIGSLGSIILIACFNILLNRWIYIIILSPLYAYYVMFLFKIKQYKENHFISAKPWDSKIAWGKDWKTIFLVTTLVAIMEYISLANGGNVPVRSISIIS